MRVIGVDACRGGWVAVTLTAGTGTAGTGTAGTPGPAANRLCRELTGSGFSIQAWGLREKLLEANACRDRLPLFEIHPELAFAAMGGGPLADSKHTRAGQAARRALLSQAVALRPDVVPPRGCPLVDLLDAAAVAWSTLRVATGTGAVVPDPPQRDPSGHEVAIRY